MSIISASLVGCSLFVAAFLYPLGGSARAQDILIATGAPTPMSYSLGRAICHLVKKTAERHCRPMETNNAIESLTNVTTGAADFALVPADMQYHAVHRTGPFAFIDANFADLRAVFSLHAETITFVVHDGVMGQSFADLLGRRINLGSSNSREAQFAEIILDALDWNDGDFALVDRLPKQERTLALCHRRVDAFLHYGPHPDPNLAQAASLCNGRIIGPSREESDKIQAKAAYMVPVTVPPNLYAGVSNEVSTIGLRMTLVAGAGLDEKTVASLVDAVFTELDRFRKMHPAFAGLDATAMVSEGRFAPFHPVAERYYRAKGLI